jgi:RNA polymerase sigma-70 factor (ECF subfamily)
MSNAENDTEELIARARGGCVEARHALLARHRERLSRMVALRLDRRLSARVDPSDVVQEVLIDASSKLDEFLERRALPFYAWLRQFAWNRLVDMHRRHVRSRRRTVARERPYDLELPEDSAVLLVRRLVDSSSPSRRVIAREQREHLKDALAELPTRDREVLVMRHLEQLSVAEIAAVMEISEGAVKARILRALLRLRGVLERRT